MTFAAASGALATGFPVRMATTEYDSSGVGITVDISPLECVGSCGSPTPTPPATALPPTGGVDLTIVAWLAVAVVAVGIVIAMIVRRRVHRYWDSSRVVALTPYDGLIGPWSSPVEGRTERSTNGRDPDDGSSRNERERGGA